jgi:CheY-like chemotaxis protein
MADEPILLVDDNPLNLKLIKLILANAGYDIRTAANADEALAAIVAQKPLVILMDLQLPGVDGLELTRRIKAKPETSDIVIVAVTAYAMKGDDDKARAAGCDGYIAKPIDTRALRQLVQHYLDKKREPT